MKDISDHILVVHQKSLCQRNKEIASFEMNSYRAAEKAAKGTYTSWMLAIMVAVTKVLRQAQSKEMFCNLLQKPSCLVYFGTTINETIWQHTDMGLKLVSIAI